MRRQTLASNPHQPTRTTDTCRVAAVDGHRLLESHRGGHALQVFQMSTLLLIRTGVVRMRVVKRLCGHGVGVRSGRVVRSQILGQGLVGITFTFGGLVNAQL